MSRKFISEKEIRLINSLNRELIQDKVGQWCVYYAISIEDSQVHDVYDESISKTWLTPVGFFARVTFGNPVVRSTGMGSDTEYELEVEAHYKELEERNISPRDGDFVEYGQIIYEITGVTRPQMVFGLTSEKIMVKMACTPAREGQFQAGNVRSEGIDNTTPIQTPLPRSLGGQ